MRQRVSITAKTDNRSRAPRDVLYGRRPVQLFLEKSPRRAHRVWIDRRLSRDVIEKFSRMARGRSVPVVTVDPGQIDRMADGGVHQGVAIEADALRFFSVDDLKKACARRDPPARFLALDSVTDPQNFGAICRTAESFGLSGLIFEAKHSPPLGGAAYKASAGAIDFIPLFAVARLEDSLRLIRDRDGAVIGLDAGASSSLDAAAGRSPGAAVAWVLGSEGRGMRPAVKSVCSKICSIPMKGRVGSLNVSAAAAIVCFASARLDLRGAERHT